MPTPSQIVRRAVRQYDIPLCLSLHKLWKFQAENLPLKEIRISRDIPLDTVQGWGRQYQEWYEVKSRSIWARIWNQANIIIDETMFKADTQSLFDSYILERGLSLMNPLANVQVEAARLVLLEGANKSWTWTAANLKNTIGMQPRSVPSFLRLSSKILDTEKDPIKVKKMIDRLRRERINYRAQLIARNETGQALNEAQFRNTQNLISQRKVNRVDKSWSTVGDKFVSAGCENNEADGAIGMDQEFSSGHLHPLRFPGCRCGILYMPVGGRVYALPRVRPPRVRVPRSPLSIIPLSALGIEARRRGLAKPVKDTIRSAPKPELMEV